MCELCKKHYHMYCVNPPLLAKPSRGYGWSCAACNDKRGQGEDPTGKSRGIKEPKRKFKQSLRQYSEEDNDKYWKGWSFRYFGYVLTPWIGRDYYVINVISVGNIPSLRIHWVSPLQGGLVVAKWPFADPDDMIYVRAPTRVGKAHQAVIPAFEEPSFRQSSEGKSLHMLNLCSDGRRFYTG